MASEIRVNRLSNRSGLSTITFANGGVQFSGITTFANGEFYVGTGATIINPGTNEFNFHTGGSNRFTINNSGANLGTGNITAVDATFTGNVSIGKTLTYEDVKNVDSVGVVTARTGVKVTGGDFTVGTAITASSVTGNVTQDVGITTFSGTSTWFKGLTANKDMYWSKSSGSLIFKDNAAALFGSNSDLQIYHNGSHSYITEGSGSTPGDLHIQANNLKLRNWDGGQNYLTGTSSGSVELFHDGNKKFETTSSGVTVTGTVAATSYTGDGSNLTGITQTTINNNANNRVITGSGTANTLEAETSLEWDGTDTLKVVHGSSYPDFRVKHSAGGGTFESFRCGNGPFRIGNTTQSFWSSADDLAIGGGSGDKGITIYSGSSDSGIIAFADGTSDPAYRMGQIIYGHGDNSMSFRTNGNTERLRIAADGKLFVGATAAVGAESWLFRNDAAGGADGCRLTVYNASNNSVNNQARLSLRTAHSETTFSSYNQGEIYIANPHANAYFVTYLGGSERLRITSAGRLGIGGVTAPDGLLHVYAGDSGGSSAVSNGVTIENNGLATLQFLSPNDTGNQIRFGDNGDNGAGWIQYVHTDNRLDIGTNGSERMRITNGGDVLIGTNTWDYPKRLNVRDASGSTISLSSADNQTGNANTGPAIEFLIHNGSAITASSEIRAWKENGTSGNASTYLKFLINRNGGMQEAYKINSRGNVIFPSTNVWFNDDATTQGEGAWRIQLKGGSGSGGSNAPSEMGYLLIDADGGHNSATMNYGIKCYDAHQNVSGHVCAGYFSTKQKWSSHTKHWGVVGRAVNRAPSSSSGVRGESNMSGVLSPVGVMGVIEQSDSATGTVSQTAAVMAINDGNKGNENIGVAIHSRTGATNTYGLMYTVDGSNSPKVYFKTNGGIANYSGNNTNLSDVSQKKDIVDAPSTWNQVKNWKIRNFRMNEENSSVPLKFGVIAQEIKTVTPNIVTVFQPAKAGIAATTISEPGPNGETGPEWMTDVPAQPAQPELLGVCDQQADWMVAKALQEAMAKIEVLEAKVAALESS